MVPNHAKRLKWLTECSHYPPRMYSGIKKVDSRKTFIIIFLSYREVFPNIIINPLQPGVAYLYPLKTSENP